MPPADQRRLGIRAMQVADVPAVAGACREADGVRILPWETVELFEGAIRKNPGFSQVAYDLETDALVGFVFAGHDGIRGGFHHLWVRSGYRRRGIARAMVDRALACFAAEQPPVRRLRLIVLGSSRAALAFWERVGFIRSSGESDGNQVVAFYMDV